MNRYFNGGKSMSSPTATRPAAISPLSASADTYSVDPYLADPYQRLFVAHITRSAGLALKQLDDVAAVPSPELRAQALLTLGYALRPRPVWPQARAMLLKLAPLMEQTGHWEEWAPFLEQGIEQSRKLNDTEALAELRVCLGNLRRRQSKLQEAADLLARAAETFQALNLPRRRAVALSRLANVARTQRDYARARQLLDTARALLPADDPELGYCYFVQGQVAIEDLDWTEASAALQQARTLAERHGDARMRALILLNLGRVCEQQRDFPAAIQHYTQAMAIFDHNQDPVHLAVTQMNLGLVYMYAEAPDQALDYYRQAESTLRKLGDRRYLAMVYNNLGMLYRDLGQWDDAEEALHAGIAIWRELGDRLARLNVEGNLAITYLRQGRYAQATQLLERILCELEAHKPDSAERQKLSVCLQPYLAEAVAGERREGLKERDPLCTD